MTRDFDFRLQRVLEYREMLEGWARDAYLAAQEERLGGDAELARINEVRTRALSIPCLGIQDRLALERFLCSVDEEEHEQRLALQVLIEEEAKALEAWIERKRDVEALVKLRNRAYEEWELELTRKEQRELDEWAAMRRAA